MYDGPGQKYVQAELLPPDTASVDWQHKPSEFKLYQGHAQLSLSYSTMQNLHDTSSLTLEQVGELLAKSYGLLQQYYVRQLFATGMGIPHALSSPILHRPVPSGGGLFPCEIYLFSGAGQQLPAGIYHYDVAHHALDILQQRDESETAYACLAHPGATCPAYILALSCFFWKDSFKYGDFSYRLQGFDLGTVIAQSLAVLNQQTISATVHYQFLDLSIDALLGLDSQYESIYALITLDSVAGQQSTSPSIDMRIPSQQEMPASSVFTSVAYSPLVEAMHQASLYDVRTQFHPLSCLPAMIPPLGTESYPLPPVDEELGLLARYRQRHSADGRFVPIPIDMGQLARFCHFSTVGYESDLDGQEALTVQHTLLYCVVNRVKEISQGIYCYDPRKRTLELVVDGDVLVELQALQLNSATNVHDLSVCFFLVGDYNAGFQLYGDRWYRIQNMEAGMMVQRLYLAAAALELGCRASLGFYQQAAHTLLQLPEHWHALIQIMVAPEAAPYGRYKLPIYP